MKKIAICLIVAALTLPVNCAEAKEKAVTFQWEQVISPDFYGWKLWVSDTPGGPYSQVDGDIIYVSEEDSYQWTTPVLTFPDGEVTTRYFVMTAFELIDGRLNESGPSNEVELIVDAEPPDPPIFNAYPAVTTETTITLAGSKEVGSSVWMDGVEILPASPDAVWAYTVILVEGVNTFVFTLKDAEGNESNPALSIVTITRDTTAPTKPFNLKVVISVE